MPPRTHTIDEGNEDKARRLHLHIEIQWAALELDTLHFDGRGLNVSFHRRIDCTAPAEPRYAKARRVLHMRPTGN